MNKELKLVRMCHAPQLHTQVLMHDECHREATTTNILTLQDKIANHHTMSKKMLYIFVNNRAKVNKNVGLFAAKALFDKGKGSR